MDTVRLKFLYRKDKIRPENLEAFFGEAIPAKTIETITGKAGGSRFILTNNKWRKEEQKKGNYMPKYWIEPDYIYPEKTYFVIELSLPKILYGSNIFPLKPSDKLPVAEKIQSFCKNIGIGLFTVQILEVVPMAVAFGKNIDIVKYTTASQAIEILSSFNDRFRSNFYTYQDKDGGIEMYFNSKSSTFKVYDKIAEVRNNATTSFEKELIKKIDDPNENCVREMIRVELTLKNSTAIKRHLAPYISSSPTLGSLFEEGLSEKLLTKEVEKVFHHQLAEFVFLSKLQANHINTLLRKHLRNKSTRLWVKDIIETIQRTGGTKGLREEYNREYRSRKTYYNHLKVAERILTRLDPDAFRELSAIDFHQFFLHQFAIKTSRQDTLF